MNFALQEAAEALDAVERKTKAGRTAASYKSERIQQQLRAFDAATVERPTMLAPVDAGAVAPEPYAPALADYPAALPEYPASLPDYPGALLEYPAALPEYPAALPAYDVALPGDYAPAPVEIPGSNRQIVPHVLIKFVPPGTLTAPAGCAPVALPPPPAAPLPAGPAYVPYDQFEPE